MSIKNMVEMIKRNGLLASMPQLEELYKRAIENEEKLAESQREFRAADATIENLQMQVEKLAAENAGLKVAAEFATAPDMWEELGGNVMRYQYQEWYADRLKSAMKTPATDDFLAEVRAQAKIEGAERVLQIVFAGGSVQSGREYLAQLRKGVQS